jgi:hypothetical protein
MTLKDHKGRENIVERFVNDLFAWVFHVIGWLLRMILLTVVFMLVIAGLVQCFSEETHASPGGSTQPRETSSCTLLRNC